MCVVCPTNCRLTNSEHSQVVVLCVSDELYNLRCSALCAFAFCAQLHHRRTKRASASFSGARVRYFKIIFRIFHTTYISRKRRHKKCIMVSWRHTLQTCERTHARRYRRTFLSGRWTQTLYTYIIFARKIRASTMRI